MLESNFGRACVSSLVISSNLTSVTNLDKESAFMCVFPGLCTGVKAYYYNSKTQFNTIYYRVFKFSGDLYYSSNCTAALLSNTRRNGPCNRKCLNFRVAQKTAKISPL